MSLKREQIAEALKKIVGEDHVVTDEQVLKESSVDRFRRFEAYHGVYRLPLPAAVVNVNSADDVAAGPDIRHVIIGNEGTLCYITEVTVKIFKYFPENNKYLGYTL